MNLYDILGVSKDATEEVLKRAYKAKASKCHPDKNPDDPEAKVKFQALLRAYNILKSQEKRKRYDSTGQEEDVPSMHEQAVHVITKVFIETSERSDFEPDNYIKVIVGLIQRALSKCKSDLKSLQQSFSKLEYLIEKTKADELFLDALNAKLGEINHNKEHASLGVEVMTKALELLKEYEYTGTIPKEKPIFGENSFPGVMDPFIS